MIFFSHSSRIRILKLTFALVCSCSEGLLTTEKHHLVPLCLLIFCILCLSIQIKYFFFLDTQGTELKSVFHLLCLFYRQDRSSLPVSYKVLHTDLSLSPICDYCVWLELAKTYKAGEAPRAPSLDPPLCGHVTSRSCVGLRLTTTALDIQLKINV